MELIGSQSALARLIGVSQQAVFKWLAKARPLPAEHVLAVEAATGVSKHELRPDIYPDETTPPAAHLDHAAIRDTDKMVAAR